VAAQLSLVRTNDYLSDQSELSLLDGDDNIWLRDWVMNPDGRDVITVDIGGADADATAQVVRNLRQKMKEALWYHNSLNEPYAVWLRDQMTNESYARQSLIESMRLEPAIGHHAVPMSTDAYWERYRIAIQRQPWWEPLTIEDTTNYSAKTVDGAGGVVVPYTSNLEIYGDIPARIPLIQFLPDSVALSELWFSFRNMARWEDWIGASLTNQSKLQRSWDISTTVSSFSDTMATKATIAVEDVAAADEYEYQRGTFVVLLRAKVLSTRACYVRLLDGFSGADDWRTQDRVLIDASEDYGNNYYIHKLGTVSIPPQRGRTPAAFLATYALRVQVQDVSGSGNLVLDRFYLMPINDGAMHFDAQVTSTSDFYFQTYPDMHTEGWAYQSSEPVKSVVPDLWSWGIPTTQSYDSHVVWFVVGQRKTQSVLTDQVAVQLYLLPRYEQLRGDANY